MPEAQGRQAAAARRADARRQADAAAARRRPPIVTGTARVRRRRAAARHAHRGDRAAAGRRRQASRSFDATRALAVPGVQQRRRAARAEARRACSSRGAASPWSPTTPGRRCAGARRSRSRGTTATNARVRLGRRTARRCSRPCARRARWCASVGDVDAALAKAARRSSRPSTTCRTSRTCRWSRRSRVARVDGRQRARCGRRRRTRRQRAARRREALGIAEDKVTVHVTLPRRRLRPQVEGGLRRRRRRCLAKRGAACPVRVQWTREDDIRHDYYNAVSAQRLTRRARRQGQGDRVAPPHRVPADRHRRSRAARHARRRRPAAGRARSRARRAERARRGVRGERRTCASAGCARVYNIFHAFAIGSFIDEIAHARGKDPRDTWLEVIGPPRIVTLAGARRREAAELRRVAREAPRRRRAPAPRDRARDRARRAGPKRNGRALGPRRAPQLRHATRPS